eukprot:NODE_63_length_25098_cov_0.440498.p11 type:complete len:274 gc:universal NODE_63_length_25098_cov_0.440498:19802-18981(-)
MQPIFHIEYSEAKKGCKSSVSYRHVYYTDKIESFVKYSANWYPFKVTRLVSEQKENIGKCPKFSPEIDTSKEKEVLYLEIIHQHYLEGSNYKSKEWYTKFIPMYQQSWKNSVGNKRRVDNLFFDEDSLLSEKRRKFEGMNSTTLKDFGEEINVFDETIEETLCESPLKYHKAEIDRDIGNANKIAPTAGERCSSCFSTPKKSKNIEVQTPSKQLAFEMDSKLSVEKSSLKITLPPENADICLECNLPIDPTNQLMCLSSIYNIIDCWMDAYYS